MSPPRCRAAGGRPRLSPARPSRSRRRSSARATTRSVPTSSCAAPSRPGSRRGCPCGCWHRAPTAGGPTSPPSSRASGPSRSRHGRTPWPPGSTTRGIKIPAGQDLALVCEDGARLFERAAAERKGASQALLLGVAHALRDEGRPAEVRLAAATAADVAADLAAQPLRELVTRSARMPLRVERERALYGAWYEFFPRSEGAGEAAGRPLARRHAADRGRTPARGRGDGLRRRLPAAGPPDRYGVPQGSQQHARPRSQRPRGALGDRRPRRGPRRDPSGPRHVRRLRRRSSSGRAALASRSRSTWRCRPPPTIPGSPSTPSGSGSAPTAPSPTPRTRRRSTRTSTR